MSSGSLSAPGLQPGEILGAIDVELSVEDLRDIDADFARVEVEGGRMNSEQMKVVDTAER